MKVKAIIFDLDNTLYDETLYLREIFCAFVSNNPDFVGSSNLVNKITKKFRSQHTNVLQGMLNLIGIDKQSYHDEIFQLYCQYPAKISLLDTVKGMLVSLKRQGFRLGVLIKLYLPCVYL